MHKIEHLRKLVEAYLESLTGDEYEALVVTTQVRGKYLVLEIFEE